VNGWCRLRRSHLRLEQIDGRLGARGESGDALPSPRSDVRSRRGQAFRPRAIAGHEGHSGESV